jgi:phosphatidylinositol alpha-1,6-mannosyltransferase
MKVLLLVLTFQADGGLEIYTREVAGSLRRLGHDVEVWSLLEPPHTSDLQGVKVRHLGPRIGPLASLHQRALAWRTASALRPHRTNFDLVLCMHPMLALGTSKGLAGGGPPYWVWTYGTDIWGDWHPQLERALAGAQKIAAISRYTAGRIWARLPEAVVPVVYPTVSTQRFFEAETDLSTGPRGRDSSPVLLTASRLNLGDAYKGHDSIIAALPYIEAAIGRPVEYRVVGSGDGLDRLRGLAQQHGVAGRVRFLGRLDEAGLIREFLACDVFVMPSRRDPTRGGSFRGEGFGIVYIEAAAVGKPVVASSQAAAPEAIRDGVTGFAVDPYSETAIAEACARLLASPELARTMGEEGRRWVRSEFSREAFDRRLAAALSDSEAVCAG